MDLGSLVVARDVGCRRVATFPVAAIWLKFVQDHPADATWMPESERVALVETLRRKIPNRGRERVPYCVLCCATCFPAGCRYFCFISGQMDSCSGSQARWRISKDSAAF